MREIQKVYLFFVSFFLRLSTSIDEFSNSRVLILLKLCDVCRYRDRYFIFRSELNRWRYAVMESHMFIISMISLNRFERTHFFFQANLYSDHGTITTNFIIKIYSNENFACMKVVSQHASEEMTFRTAPHLLKCTALLAYTSQ